jgi:3'-phosphoadenosine 5'-phosphosulfate sulfotransferase (PAPS reductase)/FAD synthetase
VGRYPTALAEAERRFYALETDIDVEDLIREWGDPEGNELVDFISFIAEAEGEPGRLGQPEDLPDIILPEDLVRPGKKKKPRRRKAKRAVEPPPYAPRAFVRPAEARPDEVELLPLTDYDYIIVSFSGGKDSVACALHLLELGIPPNRIELWHQAVDGRPHHDRRMWDWPCTESYCEAFAAAFGTRLLYQWKEGGFIGELTKYNTPTAPTTFQLLDGREMTAGGGGKPGTRLAYPAMSADLRTRWCSAYLKIDVAKKVFTNDPRFEGKRALIITGERRQESGNRSKYASAVDYSSTRTRTVHQWRPILSWFEQDVWEIMQRYRVSPHPAYYLGWSRVSCLPCIFGNPDQWASVREVSPGVFDRMATLEDKFYVAAKEIPSHSWSVESQRARYETSEAKRQAKDPMGYQPKAFEPKPFDGYLRKGESLREAADRGTSYVVADSEWLELGMSEEFPLDMILVPPDKEWETPKGAFGHSGGPT